MKFTVYHLRNLAEEKSLHVNINDSVKDFMAESDSQTSPFMSIINGPIMAKWQNGRHAFIGCNRDTLPSVFDYLEENGWKVVN